MRQAIWLLIPRSWGTLLWQTMLARDSVWRSSFAALAGSAAMSPLLFLWAPEHGVARALAAMAVGLTVWTVGMLLFAARSTGLSLCRSAAAPMLVAAVVLGAFFLLLRVHAWLALAVAITVATAATAFTPLVLRSEERTTLLAGLRRLRGRNRGRDLD